MKRKIFLILLLLVGLAACKKAVEPENVVIEFPTSYYDNSGMLEVGQSVTVTGRVMPETADQTIVWSSSNTSVATIDQNGLITALSLGECTITATSSKEGVS
ncbi:MAG: Ig-like domain-containing protein, partial [Bacilli bacterium]|nr:Ig-like domain-containing protein [Bacilli bacterium]